MKMTKEMIEVMQAYESGEQIECFNDEQWKDVNNPIWDWLNNDYRVKPKKIYVPFDTPEEFLAAQREHGGNGLISIEDGEMKEHDISVSIDGSVYEHKENQCASDCEYIGNLKDLFEDFKMADGTPCGKEIEL